MGDIMKRFTVVIAFALLAGCRTTPPSSLHTLDMTPSGSAMPNVNIDVDRLRPSEALGRKDILIKKSPTAVEYYATEQWASNLGEIVPEKLEAEFGADLKGRDTVLISGTILGFEKVDADNGGHEAHIKLDLAFRWDGESLYETPLLEKVYELTLPVETGRAADLSVTLSRGLETIAAQVVEDVNGLPEKEKS
jgi:ABC-type uncharacterized transport system auxiliary subunit